MSEPETRRLSNRQIWLFAASGPATALVMGGLILLGQDLISAAAVGACTGVLLSTAAAMRS